MKLTTKIAIFAGVAGLLYLLRRKSAGIGKIERIKRRIYKEVSMAQSAGVDFSKKYDELTSPEKESLKRVGQDVGWKQSKRAVESGKPYEESYFNSLRRAWNAVSGVQGIGRAWNVKDASGHVVLTWIEDASNHVSKEQEPVRKTIKANMRQIHTQEQPTESIQKQLLNKLPYLKTAWKGQDGWEDGIRDDFRYVVWIKHYNLNTGDLIFEGPKIATLSKDEADEIANEERKDYQRRRVAKKLFDELKIFVYPVEKININAIAGIR